MKYHTYTMELLPHEARFLVDGFVMRRFPDRLIPQSDPRYDYITKYPRAPMGFTLSEFEIDGDPTYTDHYQDSCFQARVSMATDMNEGFWPVNGHPEAHHLVDYVKGWKLPPDFIVPKYPH